MTAPIAAAAPDPHPAWMRERDALVRYFNQDPRAYDTDPAELPEWPRYLELEGLVAGTAARTPAGLRAQMELVAYYVDAPDEQVEAAIQGVLAGLGRLAREAGHA